MILPNLFFDFYEGAIKKQLYDKSYVDSRFHRATASINHKNEASMATFASCPKVHKFWSVPPVKNLKPDPYGFLEELHLDS